MIKFRQLLLIFDFNEINTVDDSIPDDVDYKRYLSEVQSLTLGT